MFAIENTHVKCVEALLTLTAYDLEDEFEEFAEGTQQLNVNAADTDGRTALTMALEKGDDEVGLMMVQMLLEFGADIDMEVKLTDEIWKGKVRATARQRAHCAKRTRQHVPPPVHPPPPHNTAHGPADHRVPQQQREAGDAAAGLRLQAQGDGLHAAQG
jgi:ankyrin repeat protein